MTISVRAATEDDIPFLAERMYDATKAGFEHGLFDTLLDGIGLSPIAFNAALIRSGVNNWAPLENSFILEEDGVRLASSSARRIDPEDGRPITPAGLERVAADLGWSPDQASDFLRRYIGAFGLFGTAAKYFHPSPYVLEFSAVIPGQQGRGIFQMILGRHVEVARSRGLPSIGTWVVVGNEASHKGLLKFGFRVDSTVPSEDYGGKNPGMNRYIMEV